MYCHYVDKNEQKENIKTCEEEDIQMRDIVHSVGIKNLQFSDEKLKLYQKETIVNK